MYYDKRGESITMEAWAALNSDPEYKRVGLTKVHGTGIFCSKVSTVYLGIDHSFDGDLQPIIFETLVFDGPLDGEGERYSTLAEAEAGHARWVEQVRATL